MGYWSDYDETYNAPRQEAEERSYREKVAEEAEKARALNGEIENENKGK